MFDIQSALLTTGGDAQLLKELACLFVEECPKLMGNLRSAVAKRDPQAVERAAHSIKGSVVLFGARTTAETAFGLETAGRLGSLDGIEDRLAVLESRIASLVDELRSFGGEA